MNYVSYDLLLEWRSGWEQWPVESVVSGRLDQDLLLELIAQPILDLSSSGWWLLDWHIAQGAALGWHEHVVLFHADVGAQGFSLDLVDDLQALLLFWQTSGLLCNAEHLRVVLQSDIVLLDLLLLPWGLSRSRVWSARRAISIRIWIESRIQVETIHRVRTVVFKYMGSKFDLIDYNSVGLTWF